MVRAAQASPTFFELHGIETRRQLTSAHLRLWEFATGKSHALPRVRHESAHFAMLLRGAMACSCRRPAYVPWQGVFHPAGAEHRLYLDKAVGLILTLEGPWLERLDEQVPMPNEAVALGASSRWIATRLVHEFRGLRPASLLVIEGLVSQWLAAAARSAVEHRGTGQPPPWFPALLDCLHSEFARNLPVYQLAAEFRVHPDHLSRVFLRQTGRSLVAYLADLRVQQLARRLAASDDPLVELALACGFSDQSHCTREFKRRTGMTPAAYRRAYRQGDAGAGRRAAATDTTARSA